MLDKKFYERLYLGFEAENYVAGKFFSIGLEAFRLPAEFGFDLLVTDQMRKTVGASDEPVRSAMPYAIQVKSRRVSPEKFKEGPNGRLVAPTAFPIKRDDLDLIIKSSNAFLVCVVSIKAGNGIFGDKTVTLWFDSTHVKRLDELGYFMADPDAAGKCLLNIEIRFSPEDNTSDYLQKLERDGQLLPAARDALLKRLPPRISRGWETSEYVSLGRRSGSIGDTSMVYRSLSGGLLDLGRIGETHALGAIN